MNLDLNAVRRRIKDTIDESDQLTPTGVSVKAGMSNSALGKFLNGDTNVMAVDKLERVAEIIGVSLRWLLFGDEQDRKKVTYLWEHIPEQRRPEALRVLEIFAEPPEQPQAE